MKKHHFAFAQHHLAVAPNRPLQHFLLLFLLWLCASAPVFAITVTVGNFGGVSTNMSFAGGTWSPTGSPAQLDVVDLAAKLDLGDVTITTNGAGDISFTNAQFAYIAPAARTLNLMAGGNVSISQVASGGAALKCVITAGGEVSVQPSGYFTNGGAFESSSVSFTVLGNLLSTGGGKVTLNCTGSVSVGASGVTTAGGDFIVTNGTSVSIMGSGVSTGGGAFSILVSASIGIGANGVNTGGGETILKSTGNVSVAGNGLRTCGAVGGGDFYSEGVDFFSSNNGLNTCGGDVEIKHTGNVTLVANTEPGGEVTSTGQDFTVNVSGVRTGGGKVEAKHTGAMNITSGGVTTDGGSFYSEGTSADITDGGINTTGNGGGTVTFLHTGNVSMSIGSVRTGGKDFLSKGATLTVKGAGVKTEGGNVTFQHTGNVSISNSGVETSGGNFTSTGAGSFTAAGDGLELGNASHVCIAHNGISLQQGGMSVSNTAAEILLNGGNNPVLLGNVSIVGNARIRGGAITINVGGIASPNSGASLDIDMVALSTIQVGGVIHTEGGSVTLKALGDITIASAGIHSGGGHINVTSKTSIAHQASAISSTPGSGGALTVTGNVNVSGPIDLGSGNVSLVTNPALTLFIGVTCKNASVSLSAGGSLVPSDVLLATGDDFCSTPAYALNQDAFGCSDLPSTVVTLTASDSEGASASCTATVTVMEDTPPTAICRNASVTLDDTGNGSITASAVNNNSSDNCGIQSLALNRTNFTCSDLGANTLTLTVKDLADNQSTCSAIVTVNENTPPTVVCQSANLTLSANGTASLSPSQVFNSGLSNDNCGGLVTPLTVTPSTFTCANLGQTSVTLTARDASGNNSTCLATVTVSDNTQPSITCPANIVRNTDAGLCTAAVTYAPPTASDNCGTVTLLRTSPANTASGSAFPKGSTLVTWQASDGASPANTATCSFTVTVNDAQLPNIACPSNITQGNDPGQCHAAVTYAPPTYSDNCAGGGAAIQSGLPSGSNFPKGINTVVWRATDAAGLTKTCSFRVTVNDTQVPTINCPTVAPTTTAANSCVSAPLNYSTPTATDNCPGAITVIRLSGPASGSIFPLGVTSVTWRAIDGAGRSSTCSFAVTVTDVTPPVITCPSSIAVTGSGSPCTAVVGYTTPTATDNCSVQSVSLLSGLASGSTYPAGATVNTWRAVDNSGGSSNCSFTVTVGCGASPSQPPRRGGDVTAERDVEGDVASPPLRGSREGLFLQITPNPAAESVLITVSGLGERGGNLTLLDGMGRVMWQQSFDCSPSDALTRSLADFPPGLYFVTLCSAEGTMLTKRLVVQR